MHHQPHQPRPILLVLDSALMRICMLAILFARRFIFKRSFIVHHVTKNRFPSPDSGLKASRCLC